MTSVDARLCIFFCLLVWLIFLTWTIGRSIRARYPTAGLPLAYVFSTAFMHSGALLYLDSSYDHSVNAYLKSWNYTVETVADGFFITTIGVFGFLSGNWLLDRFSIMRFDGALPVYLRDSLKASKALIYTGLIFTFFGAAIYNFFPFAGGAAVVGGFKFLLLTGVAGLIQSYVVSSKSGKAVFMAGFCAIIIIGTEMLSGILGDTVFSVIYIMSFVLCQIKPSFASVTRGLFALILVSYSFIFLSAIWMEIRSAIRQLPSETSALERITVVLDELGKVELSEELTERRLTLIDARLNQNVIIGKADEYLSHFPTFYAGGDTLLLAAFGWVPRAIWASKPERGGSDFVSLYTGQKLSETTTFGTGPIFEFLINFGWQSVFFLCALYGFVLRWLDRRCALLLLNGRVLSSSPYSVAGLAMINPFNTLFFMVNSALSGVAVSLVVRFLIRRLFSASRADV